jgi:hypothetical protein
MHITKSTRREQKREVRGTVRNLASEMQDLVDPCMNVCTVVFYAFYESSELHVSTCLSVCTRARVCVSASVCACVHTLSEVEKKKQNEYLL